MLSRRRRQKGSVRLRGRKTKYWEGIYWVDILDTDGQIAGRRQRFVNLGYAWELPTAKAALRKLDDILREVNAADYEPESQVTLGDFINKVYIPVELLTKSNGQGCKKRAEEPRHSEVWSQADGSLTKACGESAFSQHAE